MIWAARRGCKLRNINTEDLWFGKIEGTTLNISTGQKDSMESKTTEYCSEKEATQQWWENRWDKINDGYLAYTDPENRYDSSKEMLDKMWELVDINDREEELIQALNQGADPNGHFRGLSLAYTAVTYGYDKLLDLMISKGCDLNDPNTSLTGAYSLNLPLSFAIIKKNKSMIETLLKNGATEGKM